MEESNSIEQLPRLNKEARELSVLGCYRKSLEKYKIIFQILQQRIKEIELINDQYLLDKWKETKEKLKEECNLVLRAYQNCKIFRMDEIESDKKQAEEEKYNNQILSRDNKIIKKENKKNSINNSKRWEHFGGKPPFSYLNDKKNDENIEINISQKFIYNSHRINNDYVVTKINSDYNINNTEKRNNNYNNINYLEGFYDDPDVWTSPEEDPRFPYQKTQSKTVINKVKRPLTHKTTFDLGVVNEKNVEKRRQNYERPWQVSSTSKPNKEKDNNKKSIKSSKNINRKKNKKWTTKKSFFIKSISRR